MPFNPRDIHRRIREKIAFVFLYADYEPIEFRSALIMLVLSITFINPYTDIFTNSVTYSLLKTLFSEKMIGSFLMFSSLLSLGAYFYGYLPLRAFAASIQTFLWFFLFIVLLLAKTSVSFPWMLPIFALFEGVIVARMLVDARNSLWT